MRRVGLFLVAAVVLGLPAALRAFDPVNGDWHKSDPAHVRIMTFNVADGIGIGVNTAPATADTTGSQWAYIGLICQALAPDIICLQEIEPSGTITATRTWVQNWADEYFGAGVMHVYVSGATDGFNRNVNVSRFPYIDINGDGFANYQDIFVFAGPGGLPPGTPPNGHIRGWTQSEIDLPDAIYRGDLFIANAHLKAGGTSSDFNQRVVAAQNMAYWVKNGLNQNTAPFAAPQPLDDHTPVVICGDMNQNSLTIGPIPWLREWTGDPGDSTDRDGSAMQVAAAGEPFTGSLATFGSSSRLDYVLVQDSIATIAHAFVFNSIRAAQNNALPPELAEVMNGANASSLASDHRAVVVDLVLPLFVPGDVDGDGDVDIDDYVILAACLTGPVATADTGCEDADLNDDGHVDLRDFAVFTGISFSAGR